MCIASFISVSLFLATVCMIMCKIHTPIAINLSLCLSLLFSFFSLQNVYLLTKFPLLTVLFSNFSGDFLLFGRLLFCHFAMISFMLIHAMVFTIVNYHSNVLLAILICLSAKKSNCCCEKKEKKTVECLSSRNDIVVIGFV